MLKNRSSLALECEKERWFIKDTSRTFIFFFFFFFFVFNSCFFKSKWEMRLNKVIS